MGRGGSGVHYSFRSENLELIRAKASNVPVHFKNTVEAARPLKGMTLNKANQYLKNILAHKECVPFKRFKGGIGKCAQAKQFKTVIGRWPEKSVRVLQDLLRNVASNCDYFGKDPDDYVIRHIQVSQAPVSRRRTYRAHGRINPYVCHLSHLQVMLAENTA